MESPANHQLSTVKIMASMIAVSDRLISSYPHFLISSFRHFADYFLIVYMPQWFPSESSKCWIHPIVPSGSRSPISFPPSSLIFYTDQQAHISVNVVWRRMATRRKENRTYCQRLFDAVDIVIDHSPTAITLDLVRLLLHDPATQHREFRVWVAEHGNFLGRVVISCGFKGPTEDLGVELLGWADVNGTVHKLASLHDSRLLVTRE